MDRIKPGELEFAASTGKGDLETQLALAKAEFARLTGRKVTETPDDEKWNYG